MRRFALKSECFPIPERGDFLNNSGILQLAKMGSLTEHLPYVLPADLPAFAQRSRDLEFVLMR